MFDHNSKPAFKILAVDGGGIRGLYSAKMLEVFEERFDTSVAKHFDMICGTSTGSLIAPAVATGHPTKEITSFYKKHGPVIFPTLGRWIGLWKQTFGGKYSDRALREALEQFFGDTMR